MSNIFNMDVLKAEWKSALSEKVEICLCEANRRTAIPVSCLSGLFSSYSSQMFQQKLNLFCGFCLCCLFCYILCNTDSKIGFWVCCKKKSMLREEVVVINYPIMWLSPKIAQILIIPPSKIDQSTFYLNWTTENVS